MWKRPNKKTNIRLLNRLCWVAMTNYHISEDCRVKFPYLSLIRFVQIDYLEPGHAGVLIFLQRGYRGNFFKVKSLPFHMWFQSYEFFKVPNLYFMGNPKNSLQLDIFCRRFEHLLFR